MAEQSISDSYKNVSCKKVGLYVVAMPKMLMHNACETLRGAQFSGICLRIHYIYTKTSKLCKKKCGPL